jgi:hypothetical protein
MATLIKGTVFVKYLCTVRVNFVCINRMGLYQIDVRFFKYVISS